MADEKIRASDLLRSRFRSQIASVAQELLDGGHLIADEAEVLQQALNDL